MSKKKPMTKEEEADEIVRRLSAPPWAKSSNDLAEEFQMEMARLIAEEIDKEVLEKLKKIYGNEAT